jgi:hypothetical protein
MRVTAAVAVPFSNRIVSPLHACGKAPNVELFLASLSWINASERTNVVGWVRQRYVCCIVLEHHISKPYNNCIISTLRVHCHSQLLPTIRFHFLLAPFSSCNEIASRKSWIDMKKLHLILISLSLYAITFMSLFSFCLLAFFRRYENCVCVSVTATWDKGEEKWLLIRHNCISCARTHPKLVLHVNEPYFFAFVAAALDGGGAIIL